MVLLSVSFDRCLSFWVVVDRLGRLARFAWFFVLPQSVRKLFRFTAGLKPETPRTANSRVPLLSEKAGTNREHVKDVSCSSDIRYSVY